MSCPHSLERIVSVYFCRSKRLPSPVLLLRNVIVLDHYLSNGETQDWLRTITPLRLWLNIGAIAIVKL